MAQCRRLVTPSGASQADNAQVSQAGDDCPLSQADAMALNVKVWIRCGGWPVTLWHGGCPRTPCTHPPSPNPCDSEYDHFGACRTVSEAIGGLGRASPQGADAGEPLAIFFALLGFLDHFWEM